MYDRPHFFDRSPQPPRWGMWGPAWVDPASKEMPPDAFDFQQVPTHQEYLQGQRGPELSFADGPHALALPDVYEPAYSYPLIVWFHREGSDEEEVFEVLPLISERNYIALALRGNVEDGPAAEWSTAKDPPGQIAQRLQGTIEHLRTIVNLHPDRVILAGMGTGGQVALEVFLHRPEWFQGVASLNGNFQLTEMPLVRLRALRGRRVLLTTHLSSVPGRAAQMVATGRLLYTAGLQVATRIYHDQTEHTQRRVLRDLDHWIMDGIQSAVKAAG
ncbi:MAG: hypothetical protein KatS3mg114_1042 [Planctomycetaceae bacterium]|nr:MAG: hypothetical protein KatS3mg114_1042 [Planctomycetaceae bacterium]